MDPAPRHDTDSPPEDLLELARLAGVQTQYHDINGNSHRPALPALRAVLKEMGLQDTTQSLEKLRTGHAGKLVEPVIAIFEDEQPVSIPLSILCSPEDESSAIIRMDITDEDNREIEYRRHHGIIPSNETLHRGARRVTHMLSGIAQLPMGYYDVKISVSTGNRERHGATKLIIAPRRCHMPEGRQWGITLSLYSMRSEANWGVGDLGDLRGLIRRCESLGATFVGINPLHSTPNNEGEGISPYQPISRLYLNHIYADASALSISDEDGLAGPRDAEFVQYENIAALKLAALRDCFDEFKNKASAREVREFTDYVKAQGRALEDYASFMALRQSFKTGNRASPTSSGWQEWPGEYQSPESPSVEKFKKSHATEIEFHMFIQWTLARQLQKACASAPHMHMGLYGDLAVGSSRGGSDTWAYRDVFASAMSMGAPPDDFSPTGQDWLFPPLIPGKLRESGYGLFIDTLRNSMVHYDALRIDHALGLFRTFWIPRGMEPANGVYINSPHDEMLKIIALESVRNATTIIAEDLGTVGQGMREALSSYGMLSYRLLYFERHWDSGRFMEAHEYPSLALSAVNTHDLPTLPGFLEGSDIRERESLGLYRDRDACRNAHTARQAELTGLLDALAPYMTGETEDRNEEDIILAAYAFISRTPSVMHAVNLEDALMLRVQQNLPGTDTGHPNWKRRYPVEMNGIFRSALLRKIASILNKAHP